MTNSTGFIGLFSWFTVLNTDLATRYRGCGMELPWFMLLGMLACYGGRNGLSRTRLTLCMNIVHSGITLRATGAKLNVLKGYGYVVGVKRGRVVYYMLSSHAEKLLIKSVGRDELKRMNAEMRALLK